MINVIKVGGIVYTVQPMSFVEIGDDRNFKGACRFNYALIEIADSISYQRQQETLIHELTHAIAHEANVEMSEDDVIQFSKVLYQVLKENDFGFLKE